MKLSLKAIGLALTACATCWQASATVTVQSWYHFGEVADYYADSTPNAHRFGQGFSTCAGGGNAGGIITATGVGGPLGASGWTSTKCLRLGQNKCQGSLWAPGYNPPSTNFGIEIWVLPQDTGVNGGSSSWIFSSGQSGGVTIRIVDNQDGTSQLVGTILGAQVDVGDPFIVPTNKWTHVAMVNDNGTTTFYINGVANGASDTANATASAGDAYIGTPSDNQAYDGYVDEARVFTFAPGQFSPNDFLLPPPGPNVITQPSSATVWNGGAAPFAVVVPQDPSTTFQWQRGGVALSGQTASSLLLPTVGSADDGAVFSVVVGNGGSSLVSSNATLSVVPNRTADVAYYRSAVTGEPTLAAYFPVDGSTGTSVANVRDASRNGSLEFNTFYDGRTNSSYGERALSFGGGDDVQVPNNPALEFTGGDGTIEALIYLRASAVPGNQTIFSEAASDASSVYYRFQVSPDGSALSYANDSLSAPLSWSVPVNLAGRLAHVALVIDHGTNVTAYADGAALGTKVQSGFGASIGQPSWIGGTGSGNPGGFTGDIDELAVYSSALSLGTIQTHYSRFLYGTNVSAPYITSQPSSKTLLAGGRAVLTVTAGGTLPLSYQWTFKGANIPGATSSTLVIAPTTTNSTGDYSVTISNSVGSTNSSPIHLAFVPAPDAYSAAVLADQPTAYWRLDEVSGPGLTDFAGLNDGAYNPTGQTFGANGAIEGNSDAAVHFNGSGYALVPNTPVLNPNGAFTIEFWAQPADTGFEVPISSMNRPAGRYGWEFYQVGNGPGWEFHIGQAGYTGLVTDSAALVAKQWYHVAGVFDGTNNITLYVYGQNVGTAAGPITPNGVQPTNIGRRSDGTHYYNGTLDEIAFYNYALTAEQLQAHVAIGQPLKLSIVAATNVIADSRPGTPTHDGMNHGSSWTASESDGQTNRSGVEHFSAAAPSQVTVGGSTNFDSTVGTIAFWFRSAGTVTNAGSEGAILFDRRAGDGVVIAQHDNGNLFVQVAKTANTLESAANISDNRWHHVAVVYDQSDVGSITIYIDGALDSSQANAKAWTWTVGQELEIGQSHDSYWRALNGSLDDFRVYSRDLSGSEVASLTTGALVDPGTLELRFNFDGPPAGFNVTWPYGSLQDSPTALGPFNNVDGAASPYPVSTSAATRFFRGNQ